MIVHVNEEDIKGRYDLVIDIEGTYPNKYVYSEFCACDRCKQYRELMNKYDQK